MCSYSVWDIETNNLVGHYATEREALQAVKDLIDLYGPDYANELQLGGRDEAGAVLPVLAGPALVARVMAEEEAGLMSAEANKAVIRRFVDEVWNAGDLSVVDELVDPDYTVEGVERGPDFVRRNVESYRAAFPDLEWTIEQVVAEGDWVAVRLTLRGTHLGLLGDIPPSGKQVEMREFAFGRVVGGRMRAIWSVGDALGLRIQVGALPTDAWHRPVHEAEGQA